MTDQTTARDHAIEMDVDEALELAERVSAPGSAGQSLAAEVRRLRALAGAPTADVADEQDENVEAARRLRAAAEHALPRFSGSLDNLARELLHSRGGVGGYWARLTSRALLAAAPEGVDAADEQEPCLSRGCTAPRGHTDDHESADGDTWDNSIDDPGADGMDPEAQGEMADQLAAAQAAIQRVRDVCDEYERGTIYGRNQALVQVAARLRRALDGDTTEES